MDSVDISQRPGACDLRRLCRRQRAPLPCRRIGWFGVKTVEHVDTERMKRVLDRLYPAPRPRPPGPAPAPRPDRGESCALLELERRLGRSLQEAFHSRECRRTLRGVYADSERRARELRADCFLRPGGAMLPPAPPKKQGGVISALRESYHLLEKLAGEYENAAAEGSRRRRNYRRYSAECRRDAQIVRQLIDRLMS